MSKYNPTAVTIEELRAFGIEPTQIRRNGSRYYKIYFFLNDRERFIVVAATPSDCQAQHNTARWCAESFANRLVVLLLDLQQKAYDKLTETNNRPCRKAHPLARGIRYVVV